MSAGDTSEVMSNGKLVKPLSELSVDEVGIVLEALKLGNYKETLINNKIDGKCLMKCNTVKDVKEMGILMTVKASLLLDEIRKWKAASQDVDSEIMQGDAGTNGNDHEGSVVDDTSTIESVFGNNHEERVVDDNASCKVNG